MPTLNEYQSKRGYYVRAWTPNTGNINYKIRDEGFSVVEDYGAKHEDEISWKTIRSLKSLGLIYTDGSGTLTDDDFVPNPEQVDGTSLNEEQARKLLEAVEQNVVLSDSEYRDFCSVLGIDPVPDGIEQRIRDGVMDVLKSGDLVLMELFEQTENLGDIGYVVVVNETNQRIHGEEVDATIFVSFGNSRNFDDVTFSIANMAFISEEKGLLRFETGISGESTWDQRAGLLKHQSEILKMVVQAIDRHFPTEENGCEPEIYLYTEPLKFLN